MISVKKVAVMAAMSTAAVVVPGAMTALPASASTSASASASVATPAADPSVCSGNGFVCVQNLSNGALPATIKAWADTKGFTGHFELVFPSTSGKTENSSNGTWKAGGAGFDFKSIPSGHGYNMIVWQGSGSSFKQIDNVSFSV